MISLDVEPYAHSKVKIELVKLGESSEQNSLLYFPYFNY